MNEFLSNETIWLVPTPKIRSLHEKKILLREGETKSPANLCVADADPTGPNVGKCSVAIWQSILGPANWQGAPSNGPVSAQSCNSWRLFLNQDAVDSIRLNDPPQLYGEFLLVIPLEQKPVRH